MDIGYIISFICGMAIGSRIMLSLMNRALFRMSMGQVNVSLLPQLKTERIIESIMLYDKDLFLCQGQTIEEVASNFIRVNPIKLAQVLHDGETIWFVDGKVQTSLEQ